MKVLVSGPVLGALGALEARIRKLNASAHGPFDVVFVVGGLFAPVASDSNELGGASLPALPPFDCVCRVFTG